MIRRRILIVPVLFAMVVSMVGTIPVLAEPAPAAIAGIDDPSGDKNAPGVNVIRKVDASGTVIVRLSKGFRQAHFDVVVRGADVLAIDDNFSGAKGLESGYEDGIWTGCRDELLIDPSPAIAGPSDGDVVAQAKFYTCKVADTIRLHLDVEAPATGEDVPAIKIVFTEQVLGNVDGVFVGADPTNVREDWIPLWSDS